jgi:hypothetical protein
MDKAVLKPRHGTVAAPVHHCPDGGFPGVVGRNSRGAEPHDREEDWSAAELDPRVASPRPGRHRLSGRECILAETPHQRGNRAVTNKQFGRMLVPNSEPGIEQTIYTSARSSTCVLAGAVLIGDEGRHD